MKRKNHGFTLIELLAVIVILAIIALIAVPIVINIVNDANKKAFESSVNGLIKATNFYYSGKEMMGEELEDTVFEFPNNIGELQIDGSLPVSGSIILTEQGDIALSFTNGKYCARKMYNEKDVIIDENTVDCILYRNGAMTSRNACIKNDECDSGTWVNVQVNEKEYLDFYVISDTEEGFALILDRNLGENVAWYADTLTSTNGPLTALDALKTRTSGWTNVPDREYIINDDGEGNRYSGVKITTKARMLTVTEAKTLGCSGSSKTAAPTCPDYLYFNLSEENTLENPYGYWTSSSSTADRPNALMRVVWWGAIRGTNDGGDGYSTSVKYGVRPVITLEK